MTETLTYNATEADAPELNKAEQEALEVAEKLGAEEVKSYANKFETAEELEKAYLELQKKLGSNEEDKGEAEVSEEPTEPEKEESPGVSLIKQASDEYYANGNKLSEETMAKFSEVSSSDLINAYLEIQADTPDPTPQTQDLTDAEVNTIHNTVGGEAAYNNLLNWASETLEDSKLEAFNSLVQSGNATAISMAVSGLKAQYEQTEGYEGRMLSGKAPKSSGDVFRSQAEVVRALADPRYEKDPAYREDIYKKLERSDVAF